MNLSVVVDIWGFFKPPLLGQVVRKKNTFCSCIPLSQFCGQLFVFTRMLSLRVVTLLYFLWATQYLAYNLSIINILLFDDQTRNVISMANFQWPANLLRINFLTIDNSNLHNSNALWCKGQFCLFMGGLYIKRSIFSSLIKQIFINQEQPSDWYSSHKDDSL